MLILTSYNALGRIPQDTAQSIRNTLATVFEDQRQNPEYQVHPLLQESDIIRGNLCPDDLIQQAENWMDQIKSKFMEAMIPFRNKNLDDLPCDNTKTYLMKKAAMALDNDWFDQSDFAVYLPNATFGISYFSVFLTKEQLVDILSHPDHYLIVNLTII